MNRTVGDAEQQPSEARRAATLPQVDAKNARRKRTVAEAFEELRLLSGTQGPALKAPPRRSRA